ncbi:MAG: OmpA family protein [Kiritimatiellae bacterium]|nr:OmpA family protein [Kiritimatiellia bacterium]
MNKLGVVFAGLVFGCLFSVVAAEEGMEYRRSVSVGAGALMFERDEVVEDGAIYSLGMGMDLSERWSVEGTLYVVPTLDENFANSNDVRVSRLQLATGKAIDDLSAWGIAVDGLYHFTRWERYDPYLTVGVGVMRYDEDFGSETDASVRLGGGMMYHFTDQLSARVDARVFVAGDDTEFNAITTAGLMWSFGASAPSTYVSTPTDWDGDGLSNEQEIQVGTDPCDVDSDNDGLIDAVEVQEAKTDPLNMDSDYDALTDADEIEVYKTDPLKRDTDGGKVSDGHEVLDDSTDPLVAEDDFMFFELAMQFEGDESSIKPEYLSDLDAIAAILKKKPDSTARIEAHDDGAEGRSRRASRRVTRKQAQAVDAYMTQTWKIDAGRIEAIGYGMDRPKGPTDPETGKSENRRVEIYLRGAK